jgi:hypothetical protein
VKHWYFTFFNPLTLEEKMSGSGIFQCGRGGYNHNGSGLWINAKRLVEKIPGNHVFQTLPLLKKDESVSKKKFEDKVAEALVRGLICEGDFAELVS